MARKKSATVDLKVRMKEPLRARLEKAAAQDGVSLNAEAVKRLEESFRREKRATDVAAQAAGGVYASFGGIETFMVMRLLANAIAVIEAKTGSGWQENVETHRQVKKACAALFDIFPPSPDEKASRLGLRAGMELEVNEAENLGRDVAIKVTKDWLHRDAMVNALRRSPSSAKAAGD